MHKLFFILFLFVCQLSLSKEKKDSVDLSWIDNAHDFENLVEISHDYLHGVTDRDTNIIDKYSFIAIAFLVPKQGKENGSFFHIAYTIKNLRKKDDANNNIIINNASRRIDNSFFKPLFVFGNYTNERLEILKVNSLEDYVLTPKGLYSYVDRSQNLFYGHFFKKNFILARYFKLFCSNQEYTNLTKGMTDSFLKNQKIKCAENGMSSFQNAFSEKALNAEFVALGMIRGMKEKKRKNLSYCDIRIVPYFIYRSGLDFLIGKRSTNIGVGSEYWKDRENSGLPISELRARKKGQCFSSKESFHLTYFLGSYDEKMEPNFLVDSLASPLDFFYFDGKLVDLRMEIPYDSLLSYFLPPNLSVEDFYRWSIGHDFKDDLDALTPSQQKEIENAINKFDKYYKRKNQKGNAKNLKNN